MRDAEEAAETAVDEHRSQKQYVHGVGTLFVAKTRNSSQYVSWNEVQDRPSIADIDIDPSDWEIDASQITTGTIKINRLPIADAGEINEFKMFARTTRACISSSSR
ncbi:MAG: hypothetical protein HC910_21890 [Spirulinaceae cyanobacterium SM2_1_0]|nr:hypothetical protein [Spirulinaceae cyanobacterium SM2_1_0]